MKETSFACQDKRGFFMLFGTNQLCVNTAHLRLRIPTGEDTAPRCVFSQ